MRERHEFQADVNGTQQQQGNGKRLEQGENQFSPRIRHFLGPVVDDPVEDKSQGKRRHHQGGKEKHVEDRRAEVQGSGEVSTMFLISCCGGNNVQDSLVHANPQTASGQGRRRAHQCLSQLRPQWLATPRGLA